MPHLVQRLFAGVGRPRGEFSVTLSSRTTERILGCVHVRDVGFFVTADPAKMTLAEPRRKIEGRTTILHQVRRMPAVRLHRRCQRKPHVQAHA